MEVFQRHIMSWTRGDEKEAIKKMLMEDIDHIVANEGESIKLAIIFKCFVSSSNLSLSCRHYEDLTIL